MRSLRWLLALGMILVGCQAQASSDPRAGSKARPTGTLTVLAAASLSDAFGELASRFESAHPGVRVALSLAGSQQLAQQLAQGAPGDVFASANRQEMDHAVQAGRVAAGSARVFAHNRLTVVLPRDNPAGLVRLQDLAKPGLRLVLAAAEVPVGQYALQFLDKASQETRFGPGFKGAVLKNVASYEENVKSVLTKVELGEADAGIVYATDAGSASAAQVSQIEIPEELNSVAEYSIAPLADAAQPRLAQEFVQLVLSPEGQEVLAKYGFAPGGE